MKKRFMSMLLVLCMVFTLFPSAAFAEETGGVTIGNTALGTSSVTDSGAPTVCENHAEHDKDCGYIEAVEGIDCSHQNEDGTYSCAPVKDSGNVSGNVASPGDAEEAYVCDHSDDCGYAEAVKGNPCTHECGLCKPAAKCDCIEECIAADDEGGIEGLINPDCPFCAAEGADLAECKGEAPALLATPRAASTGDKGIFAGRYSHRQVFDCARTPTDPVQGEVFKVYSFQAPYGSNQQQLENIAGKIFYFKPSNVADAPFALYMMDADGGDDTQIFASGKIYGLGAEGFLFEFNDHIGTFISNKQAFNYSYSESLTYTPDIAGPISLAEGEAYAANVQLLGVEEVTNTDTGAKYHTLQDAIDAVATGETLQLNENLAENVTIPSGNAHSFTIDLNGKTLDSNTGTAISHECTGTLTITDSSTGKAGKVSSTSTAIYNSGTGKVTVSGGEVSSTGVNGYAIKNFGKVTVSGGKVSSTGVNGYAIGGNGAVTITGGSPVIKGGKQAMDKAPDTSSYANVKVVASKNYDGTNPEATYDAAKISDYKYLTFETAAANAVTNITKSPQVSYSTLQAAIDAVGSGETLQLGTDLKENVSITNTNTSSFTIDLNGKTLDGGNGDAITHEGTGTLTITDSSAGKAGTVTSTSTNSYAILNNRTGTVAVSGGKVSSAKKIAIFNKGTVTVSGGTVSSAAIGLAAIINWGTVTVSGGTVSSSSYAIYNNGTVTVSGGTVSSTNSSAIENNSTGTVTITGGSPIIKGGDKAMNTAPTLGTGVTVKAYSDYTAQTPVTPYNSDNIADYKYLKFETAAANAVTNTTTNTPYSTLQKAIDAVAEGDTLQLGTDLTENVKIYNTKNFTIDLNGKTLDGGSGTAIDHQGSGTLTITDSLGTGKGTVSSQSSTAISVANGSLTVTGGTIDSTNNSLAISNFGTGKVTVSGGKVSATDTAIYSVGEVTVSGSAIVDSTNGHAIFNYGTSKVSIPSGSPVIKGLIRAMNTAPDTSSYANVKVVASINYDGTDPEAAYNPNDIASYKYLTFETGSTQPEATVTTVAVTPKTANVQQGTNQQFNAAVTGTNSPAQTVTWEVTGGAKSGTTINASGLLTVAADETATSLTVTATSTIDNTKSGTATVTVTTTPVTKYTLTVTGGTGGGSYEAGTSVTVTANTAPGGQRFKEWTATGITLGDKTQNPVTITMPAGSVTLTAIYENIPTGSHTITATVGTGGSISPSGSVSVSAGDIKTFTISASSGYSISSVTVDGVNQGAIGTYTFSNVTADHTISATFSSNGGGGGGGGGGSSSGGSSNIVVTPPAPDKPNDPTKAEIKVETKVDGKGGATVNVTDKDITDAINKATAEAKKNGDEANGITIVLNATTGNKTVNTVTVNLPKTVQEKVISNKIVSTVVVVDNPDIKIGMDLKAVTEINTQAKSDVTITATRMDSSKLTGNAKTAIGSRPVFDLTVNIASATGISSGKQVQSFGSGSVSVSIPYTLQSGEVAGGVYAVYVDGNGKVNYITNSSYDANAKVLRFATNHFSVYGIGYKAPIAFTDIATHWAKADIEFVVNRGLMSGTSNTTFAPDSAMTRGMFVTALGRLAGVDVNSYKSGKFTDVKADAYYAPYVNWAASRGITSGTTATTFSPDTTVTRQEMAVLMSNYAKAYGYTVPKTRTEVTFADNSSIGSWAADAVKQMQMAGILNGKDGNKFDPTGTATRGEISAMLHRYVELVIDRTTAEGWTTNDSGSGMYYQSGKAVTGTKTINSVAYNFNTYGEKTE